MYLTRRSAVETVRRYSKQPHLWRLAKRGQKILGSREGRPQGPGGTLHKIKKLSQRLSPETDPLLKWCVQKLWFLLALALTSYAALAARRAGLRPRRSVAGVMQELTTFRGVALALTR
jgi:hypothetical protein